MEVKVRTRLIAALYGLLLVLQPLAHHDLADHVKSPSSHCQLCTARPQAARAEPRVATVAPLLPSAGEVAAPAESGFVALVPLHSSGRAPPAPGR
jgi:hypothetical protein